MSFWMQREPEGRRKRKRTVAVDRVADLARAVDDLEGDLCAVGEVGHRVDVGVGEPGHAHVAKALEDVDVVERGVVRGGRADEVDRVRRAVAAAKADAEHLALELPLGAEDVARGCADVGLAELESGLARVEGGGECGGREGGGESGEAQGGCAHGLGRCSSQRTASRGRGKERRARAAPSRRRRPRWSLAASRPPLHRASLRAPWSTRCTDHHDVRPRPLHPRTRATR